MKTYEVTEVSKSNSFSFLSSITYCKSAELASAALLPDGCNLRHLGGDAQDARHGLQVAQKLHIDNVLSKQGCSASRQGGDKHGSQASPAAIVQDQHRDDDILGDDQGGLAVGAEGEAVADVVSQGDQIRARLEEVGQERHAFGRLGLDELEDLRDLDDGSGGDDADTQTLRDGKLEAFRVLEIDVVKEDLVAGIANDGDA